MNFSLSRRPHLFAQALLCAILLSMPAWAQQAPPSADTYSSRSIPNLNYGTRPQLNVSNEATSFLQFNLSALPANATVSRATLRLYVNAVTGPGTFDVYQVDTPWSESTLTFTNAPTPGVSATGSNPVSIGKTDLSQFILVDITSLAQGWVNGSVQNNGLALALTSTAGGFSFDSKESELTGHEPELEITLAEVGSQGPQGPPGPQGIPGPTGAQGPAGNLVPGSPLYIQNGSATQTGASFNIDGNGTAGGTLAAAAVNSTNGYQIGGVTQFKANSALGNLMIGESAGNSTITGGNNQLIGGNAGLKLTTGNADVFIGSNAGISTTTGNGDVYIGVSTGFSGTTAAYNTFLGAQAAPYNTTGGYNVITGFNSGFSNTTGANNTYIGAESGAYSTTASHNTFVGFNSGLYNTTGGGNLFLGDTAGAENTTGNDNVYLANYGVGAENDTTRIGSNQTNAYIAGIYGASVSGGQAVYVDSSGHLGTAGGGSLSISGAVNSTGGYQENGQTVFNQDSLNDTMIGIGAGNGSITGGDSQFIGRSAGAAITSGNADVFIGGGAGQQTTTGNGDVYVGWQSGPSATTGAYNTFLGAQAGLYNTTGSANVFVGFNAGANNTTGSGNLYFDNAGTGGENNTIRIGNGQSSAYIAGVYGVTSGSGVPVYIDANGQLGTFTSSRKYKEEIQNMGDLTGALMRLRPVTFFYKPEYDKGQRTRQYGLIAEEVAKVFPDLVAYNPDGAPYTVRYQYLSSILLSAFQEQNRKAQEQAGLIQQQQQRIQALEQRLSRIESMLSTQDGSNRAAGLAVSSPTLK